MGIPIGVNRNTPAATLVSGGKAIGIEQCASRCGRPLVDGSFFEPGRTAYRRAPGHALPSMRSWPTASYAASTPVLRHLRASSRPERSTSITTVYDTFAPCSLTTFCADLLQDLDIQCLAGDQLLQPHMQRNVLGNLGDARTQQRHWTTDTNSALWFGRSLSILRFAALLRTRPR